MTQHYEPLPADSATALYGTYPFLRFDPGDRSQYIPPEYYDQIIKPYTFDGVEDLALMKPALETVIATTSEPVVVELGGGSGRATSYILNELKARGAQPSAYHVNDLSPDMIAQLQELFGDVAGFRTHQLDHLEMLESLPKTTQGIDFLFSQWSLSHSIHQHIEKDSFEPVLERVYQAFNGMIDALADNAEVHIIHFDTASQEQKIMVRQYAKLFWEFADVPEHSQSLSKRLLDDVMKRLASERTDVTAQVLHHVGDPIHYASMDEALEVFLNFHAEGELNHLPSTPTIIQEMTADLQQYQQSDGSLLVQPGCFTYELKKLSSNAERPSEPNDPSK